MIEESENRFMTPPEINTYHFGMIKINGKSYHKDVIILPGGVINNWRRKTGHVLMPVDMTDIFNSVPELLIIGQGAYNRMEISPETVNLIKNTGLDCIALPTDKACDLYNQECKRRRVAAALHLTC